MGFGLSPVRGFYCQAQRLANVFTEYLQSFSHIFLYFIDLQKYAFSHFKPIFDTFRRFYWCNLLQLAYP